MTPVRVDEHGQLHLFACAPYTLDHQDNGCPCHDCRHPTMPKDGPHEWYMVREDVWRAAGMGPFGGYLCISCLETRLGRRLDSGDFTDVPVNAPSFGVQSARLLDRLLAPARAA